MFRNKKIIVVTPAGRREYLDLLIPQVYRLRNIVDEYHLWVNTDNKEDIAYMQDQEKKYPNFLKIIYSKIPLRGCHSIFHFFEKCIDESSVYVRFDDDIIWLDTADQFKKFLSFRIDNPQYFLVYANILNNAVMTHLQQRFGNISLDKGISGYGCKDPVGWNDNSFIIELHNEIISENNFEKYRFNSWILYFYERVSINAISWLGSEFTKFGGIVGHDEEQWLSVDKPNQLKMPNAIFGQFLVVHYAFHTQRSALNKTDILERYKKIIN